MVTLAPAKHPVLIITLIRLRHTLVGHADYLPNIHNKNYIKNHAASTNATEAIAVRFGLQTDRPECDPYPTVGRGLRPRRTKIDMNNVDRKMTILPSGRCAPTSKTLQYGLQ